jgi:RinA family phage transcriptional activator
MREAYNELHRPQLSAPSGGLGVKNGGLTPRATETLALRELDPWEQSEYDAVTNAIASCLRMPDGEARYKLIDLMYWKRTHTMNGAAMQIPTSYKTAERWHGHFIRSVAANLGMYWG